MQTKLNKQIQQLKKIKPTNQKLQLKSLLPLMYQIRKAQLLQNLILVLLQALDNQLLKKLRKRKLKSHLQKVVMFQLQLLILPFNTLIITQDINIIFLHLLHLLHPFHLVIHIHIHQELHNKVQQCLHQYFNLLQHIIHLLLFLQQMHHNLLCHRQALSLVLSRLLVDSIQAIRLCHLFDHLRIQTHIIHHQQINHHLHTIPHKDLIVQVDHHIIHLEVIMLLLLILNHMEAIILHHHNMVDILNMDLILLHHLTLISRIPIVAQDNIILQ